MQESVYKEKSNEKTSEGKGELSSFRALELLREHGFQFFNDWNGLTAILEVPLDKRRELKAMAERYGPMDALEEGLDYFIRNNEDASWELLFNAVHKTNKLVAGKLRKHFSDTKKKPNMKPTNLETVQSLSPIQQNFGSQERVVSLVIGEVFPNGQRKCSALERFLHVKPIDCNGHDLPYSVRKYNPFQACRASTCYLSFHASHHGCRHIHETETPNMFCFLFDEKIPLSECRVELILEVVVTENSDIIHIHHREHVYCFYFPSMLFPSVLFPSVLFPSVPLIKMNEFSRNGKYLRFSEAIRKNVLSGVSVDSIFNQAAIFSEEYQFDDDCRAIIFIHLGFFYQIKRVDTEPKSYEKSNSQLELAIEVCLKGNCKNKEFLYGRACIFMAQNCFYADKIEPAVEYVQLAKESFSKIEQRHEKSGLLYQEAMLLTVDELEGKQLSDKKFFEVEELMKRAIDLAASGDSDYEAPCLRFFMLIKLAMLYLRIFNFIHSRFTEMPLDECRINENHLSLAFECLSKVPKHLITGSTSFSYRALYYLAMSDYRRHSNEYAESLISLTLAENEFHKCNFQFPQEKVNCRKDYLKSRVTE